jgi:hypothetical protein
LSSNLIPRGARGRVHRRRNIAPTDTVSRYDPPVRSTTRPPRARNARESALKHIKRRQPKLKSWRDMTYNMLAQMLARHRCVSRESRDSTASTTKVICLAGCTQQRCAMPIPTSHMLHVLPHAHILTSWFLLCMHRRRHPGGDFACSLGGECLSGQAQQRCARFPQTQTHTWPCLSLLSLPHALRTMSCCMCTGAIIEAVTSRAVLDEIENQAGLMFNMATPSIAPSRAAPLAALDAPRCVCWGCGRPLTGHRCVFGLGPDFQPD